MMNNKLKPIYCQQNRAKRVIKITKVLKKVHKIVTNERIAKSSLNIV